MLKILGIICDIFMVLTLVFSILYAVFLLCWGLEIPMPFFFKNGMNYLIEPFVPWVRDNFEVYYFHYKVFRHHWFESTYGVLLAMSFVTFGLFALASSYFHRWDYQIRMWLEAVMHNLFLKHVKARSMLTEAGLRSGADVQAMLSPASFAVKPRPKNVNSPVLVAFGFSYLQDYTTLDVEVQRKINELAPEYVVFNQKNYVLLLFKSLLTAIQYVQDFIDYFEQLKMMIRMDLERQPSYRVAIHSLMTHDGICEDETFTNAILNCVAPNQIFISTETKVEYEQSHMADTDIGPVKILPVGTFSKLGDRTFPELYRLEFWRAGREQAG